MHGTAATGVRMKDTRVRNPWVDRRLTEEKTSVSSSGVAKT